ncbi:transglutaminase-like domain-containing protein [Hanstruepera ponticola]|uniref:transglutaminase-like domain-containing protein n=1 Tax=Hanstruepera ponticola TaxID=2042995 RepID=UPI000CF0D16D|nr:transglutaminase-like domain-containing protein [Hanstruepera ponticola]
MFKYSLTFLFSFILVLQLNAQKNTEPTQNEIAQANTIKESFQEDNVAVEKESYHITFDFNKSDQKVTVFEKINKNLINLDSRADIQAYCFYDGESEIESFTVKYKTNRDADYPVNDEAIKSRDLFHNDARVKYVNLDFPLKGYKYTTETVKKYKDIKYFTSLYFNDDFPTLEKQIIVEIPDWLDLELKEMNFDGYDIKKTVEPNTKNNSKIYSYTLENIAGMYKDESAPGPSYIYPHILVLAKSYTYGGEQYKIFESTQDLYNWYKLLVNSLENDNTVIKAKVEELTKDAKTDEEKIKNIYYWVQDNIRYIAFEDGIAGFKPDEASNVFKKRYGDCKGMANLTKQMLLEAGFDARITWIGTKRIAYDYSTPNLSVDNHMICTLMKDNKPVYLDGTEKFNAYGEFADRIQGKQVLIENGDSYILNTVPVSDAGENIETYDYKLKIVDDVIFGSVSKKFEGESRSSLLQYLNQLKTDKKEDFLVWYLNKGNSNIGVVDVVTSDLSNREIPVNLDYFITIKNAISSFDGTAYIDLDFEKELSGYYFDERKTDYILDYKKHLISTTTLDLPEGYTVSELPKNINASSENFDLSVTFTKQGNSIIYKKDFKIKNAIVKTSDFETWNVFIKNLKALYNEQIILTKS